VARVGFGQDATIDEGPGISRTMVNRDWRALDRVVEAADQSTTHVRLISGPWRRGVARATGEFSRQTSGTKRVTCSPTRDRTVIGGSSYWTYLKEVVSRYAGNPAIFDVGAELGEPEAADCAPGYSGGECYSHKSCPRTPRPPWSIGLTVCGAQIHEVDPGAVGRKREHLADEQCGWARSGELRIDEATGVDVASFHDYGNP